MSVQFQYVPTSGSLSGESFEKQTEQAFNELGSTIDASNVLVKKAVETANTAKQLADSAVLEAQQSTIKAEQAQNTADTAYNKGVEGIALAKKAQTTADTALDLAAKAQAIADNALATGKGTQTTANTALEIAKKAQTTADTALDLAKSASLKANAINNYLVDDTKNIDANEHYMSTEWLFITSDSKKNFPDLKIPCYFTVSLTDDGKSILQTAQEKDTPNNIFYRTGSLDTTNDNVTWGAWADSQELAKEAQVNTRVALTKATTFYVRSDGNDKNDGLANTAQKAFKSIQGALNYIYSHIISSRYDITIQVGEGIFDSVSIDGRYSGISLIYIKGAGKDKTTITNKNTNTYYAFYIGSYKRISFSDIGFQVYNEKVTDHDTVGLLADLYSQVTLQDTKTEVIESKLQNGARAYNPYGIMVRQHSSLTLTIANELITTSTVTSSRIRVMHNYIKSVVLLYGTIKSNGTIGVFMFSADLSYSYANKNTIITGTVVGKRYQGEKGSFINVLGQGKNFFPGTIAGTIDSTAHYA